MTDQQKQALQYLAAAVNDYASGLPPSVRGPFARECQSALITIEAGLTPKPEAKPAEKPEKPEK